MTLQINIHPEQIFQKKSSDAYTAAQRKGWLDDICLHMPVYGHLYKRLIYSFEFDYNEEKYVYVGLSCNVKNRCSQHMCDGPVYDFIQKTGKEPIFKILTDLVSAEDAQKLEAFILDEYIQKGWIELNRGKTGGLGAHNKGYSKYTYDICKGLASDCNGRNDFCNKNRQAYHISCKNNWVEEFFPERKIKPQGYWIYERCQEESKKHTKKSQFQKSSSGAYNSALKNNWLYDFYPKLNLKVIG